MLIFWNGSEYFTLCTWGYLEELSVMDICAPNARVPTFIKGTLLKLKAPHAVIVGDFNTPMSSMNWSGKHKQRHSEMNRNFGQKGLTDIYRTFHTKAKEYTFFSAPHCTFSKIDHISGHKTHLNRYEKVEIISCLWSDDYRLRLIFNSNKNNQKTTFTWKLNKALLNDTLVMEEIRNKIKDILEFNENEGTTYPNLWGGAKWKQCLRKIHSSECLEKEIGESIH